MPLFEGHSERGLQRLFIEMPDNERDKIVWKWPDQQIVQHSQLNVDLDYQAVFTNLGKVIGVMGPGRYPLNEGASLALDGSSTVSPATPTTTPRCISSRRARTRTSSSAVPWTI